MDLDITEIKQGEFPIADDASGFEFESSKMDVKRRASEVEESFASYSDLSFVQKMVTTTKLAIPSILCMITFYLQEMINIYFVSHLDDKSLVSAVGLGNMIQNAFIIAVICSLNAVIETLVS